LSGCMSGEYVGAISGFCPLRYNRAMFLVEQLAGEKICEATTQGELDNLPGVGKPLYLDDDALIPEALRAGFRLLKIRVSCAVSGIAQANQVSDAPFVQTRSL